MCFKNKFAVNFIIYGNPYACAVLGFCPRKACRTYFISNRSRPGYDTLSGLFRNVFKFRYRYIFQIFVNQPAQRMIGSFGHRFDNRFLCRNQCFSFIVHPVFFLQGQCACFIKNDTVYVR